MAFRSDLNMSIMMVIKHDECSVKKSKILNVYSVLEQGTMEMHFAWN